MSDRELLELAAKAAGYVDFAYCELCGGSPALYIKAAHLGMWAPLTDDGDALRLAVKLHIDISSYKENDNVHAHSKHSLGVGVGGYHSYQAHEVMTEKLNLDPMAATRRAIVRAAANIGKAMP